MKKVLSNNQQVAHYFANSVQEEGKASNFYFETDREGVAYLFSYGRHFCVARRITRDVFAMTTSGYSNSTARHMAYTRSALSHKTVVYCNDPSSSAADNKRMTQADINSEMRDAETERRILQRTRDAHKARALYLAERFNAYLAALPEVERAAVEPFDVSGLDELRAAMRAEEVRKAEAEAQRKARAAMAEADYVKDWRNDPTMATQGMLNHPIALRLACKPSMHSGFPGPTEIIQTSRGAEIPVSDARALWPVLLSVMRKERTPEDAARLVRRLGVYTLTTIRADGSIVVGCHDIAFNELARMAVTLNLAQAQEVVA